MTEYNLTVAAPAYALSLSRTGGQGTKGDSVVNAYIDGSNDLHIVINNAAGEAVSDINVGGSAYLGLLQAAQTGAETAQTAAELALDTFDDRFLGVKTNSPTLDNDNNALLTGALYFDSTSSQLGIYNGSAWEYPALEASTSATAAAASATAANVSEGLANNYKVAASNSATAAATSETNAAGSQVSAFNSATTATQQAANSLAAYNNSAASAAASEISAQNASDSEDAAAISATGAAASAVTATVKADLATTKASEAYNSAVAAASSETDAQTAETNAAGSALDSFNYSQSAATSATNAATSATTAATQATNAATSASTASTKAAQASTSAANALTSENNAATSETNAATSETNAAASETSAGTSALNSYNSQVAAASSETNASTSASSALTSKNAAAGSATAASTSATNAATSLAAVELIFDTYDDRFLGAKTTNPTLDNDGNALLVGAVYYNSVSSEVKFYNGSTWEAPSTSATNAATSATNSATAAATSETNAATSETNAGSSETNAANSATAASNSATAAATSETNALASEVAAGLSETAAAASESAALASQTAAATSETNAGVSEGNAASSATSASNSATAAGTSETNAAASETAAATSETNAASSASGASTSASTATTQATNAATSASNASTSETNAATSETNAASSETAAASLYDQFDDRYLGAKASDPTLDNDGAALLTGAMYFDSVNLVTKVYNGSAWQAASSSIEGIKTDFLYTAIASQTLFVGSDDNSNTLVIDKAGLVSVYMNGVRLIQGTDYTVNLGADSITLTTGAAVNDTIEVQVFGNFAGQSGAEVAITGGVITGLSQLGMTSVTVTDILDEDNLVSNSATALATQQSIKAYVDAQVGTVDTLAEILAIGNTTGGTDLAVSAGDDITFTNSSKAIFGTGSSLEIYGDGSDSYIDEAGSGRLWVRTSQLQVQKYTGETILKGIADGTVELYYDDALKLATTATGIDVTGTVVADGLTVNVSVDSDSVATIVSSATANNTQLRLGTSGNDSVISGTGASTGALAFKVYGTERLRIDSSGNVGIGTASPKGELVVYDAGTDTRMFIQHSGTGTTNGDGLLLGAIGSNFYLYGYDAYPLIFGTNNTERLRIDSSGNVGIGTTSPATALSIVRSYTGGSDTGYPYIYLNNTAAQGNGSTTFNQAMLRVNAGDGAVGFLRATYDSAGPYGTSIDLWSVSNIPLRFATNNTERMRIDSGGHVMISGTANGGLGNFSLGDTADARQDANIITSTTGFGSVNFADGTTGADRYRGYLTYRHDGNYMQFGTDAVERMRIDSSGNVLVGKTSADSNAVGIELHSNDVIKVTRSGGAAGYFNRQTSDGSIIDFAKDGATVGSIGAKTSMLTIGSGDVGLYFDSLNNRIIPFDTTAQVNNDAVFDIGAAAYRLKDLYLSNAVRLGDATLQEINGTDPFLSGNAYYDGSNWKYVTSTDATNYYQTGQQHIWRSAASGTAGATITWSESMRIDSSGNVGIGTTSPAYKLDVNGAINYPSGTLNYTGTAVPAGANNQALYVPNYSIGLGGQWGSLNFPTTSSALTTTAWWMLGRSGGTNDQFTLRVRRGETSGSDQTAYVVTTSGADSAKIVDNHKWYTGVSGGTERMRIDSSGNVGIGQTPSATSAYMVALQIGEQGNLYGHTDGTGVGSAVYLSNNITHNGGFKYINSDTGAMYEQASGVHKWYSFPSGTAGAAAGQTERMRIDSSGNVGIGTSSPAQSLDTTGKIRVRDGGNTTIPSIQMGPSGVDGLSLPTTNNIAFITNSSEAMRIDSTGNVGIGTSSPSTYGGKLHVASAGSTQTSIMIQNPGIGSGHIGLDASSSNIKIYNCWATGLLADGVGIDIARTTGNVGIGYTAPTSKLMVNQAQTSGVADLLTLRDASSGATFNMQTYGDPAYGTANRFDFNGAYLAFRRSGSEVMRIDSSGHLIAPQGITLGTAVGTYAAANTLDDYEEGTWTPTITSTVAGINYAASLAVGKYTKIGRLVTANFLIIVTSVTNGGGSGNKKIDGLPFTQDSNAYQQIGVIGYNDVFTTDVGSLYAIDADLQIIPAGVTQGNEVGVITTGYLSGSITYTVN